MAAGSPFSQVLRLSRHSLVYGLGAAVAQLTGFLLIPLYTRVLTPADYGVLSILTTTISVFLIMVPLGVTSGLSMAYFQNDDAESRRSALSSALLCLTGVAFLLMLLLQAAATPITRLLLGSQEYTPHFRVAFLTVFLDSGIALCLLMLRIQEKSVRYAVIVLGQLLGMVLLNILMVVLLRLGVLGILLSRAVTSALLYAIMVPRVVREAGLRLSLPRLRGMISYGLPYVPSNLASWIMTLSDRYFLRFLSTTGELGLYSLGFKFGMVMNVLIVRPFALAWGPFFWSVAKEERAPRVYASVLTYFLLGGVAVVLGLSVLSREALVLMATPRFYGAWKVIPFVALSYLLFGCFSIFSVGIALEKKTKFIPVITGVGAVANLALNALLIPGYGMMGAAAATLTAKALLPVGAFLISRRYHRIPYEWSRLLKVAVAAGLTFGVSLTVRSDSVIAAASLKLVVLLLYPLLLVVMRFLRDDEVAAARKAVSSALSRLARKSTG